MISKEITIRLENGLEARPVAMLVQVASQHDSTIYIQSAGKRVNASGNTKISIISREKNQNIEVYYLNSDGESVKLKSKKEKYTVKFNMKENGYYSLVINDKNISINDELDNNDNIDDAKDLLNGKLKINSK